MKLLSVPALLVLVPILLTQFHLPSAEKDVEPEVVETARAEVIVWFREEVLREDALKVHIEVLGEAFRGIESETERNGSLHLATFSAEKKVREALEEYGKFREVKRAEPNFVSMAEPGEPVRGVSSGIAYTLADDKITLHWGRKRTGGYSIDIKELDFDRGMLLAYYSLTSPEPGQPVPHVITYPEDIAETGVKRDEVEAVILQEVDKE